MEEPHLDDVFVTLSYRSRRKLLDMLIDQPTGLTVSEMAAEMDDTGNERLQLTHRHLPKLDALEYIDWDRTEDQIGRGARWDDIEPVVELLRSHQDELPGGWV